MTTRTQKEIDDAVDIMIDIGDGTLFEWLIAKRKLNNDQLLKISTKNLSYNVKADLLNKYHVTEAVYKNLLKNKTKATNLICACMKQKNVPLAEKQKILTKDFIREITSVKWGYYKDYYAKTIESFTPDVKGIIENYKDCKDIIT